MSRWDAVVGFLTADSTAGSDWLRRLQAGAVRKKQGGGSCCFLDRDQELYALSTDSGTGETSVQDRESSSLGPHGIDI